MNHELLLYSYYPEALGRRPRPDLPWLVAALARQRSSSRKGGDRGIHAPDPWRRGRVGEHDLDQAIELASRIPVAHRGSVEIRPLIEN
jgi:hypothetical protein